MSELMPGTRVKAFDPRLFKNDEETPLSVTRKLGTIIRTYAMPRYPWGLCDIHFDHRGVSEGHFVNTVEIVSEQF